MTTTALVPRSFAARATPCAWLPDECATIPRFRQRSNLVIRAPDFERADPLQVFCLKEDLIPDVLIERLGPKQRRLVNHRLYNPVSVLDIVKCYHVLKKVDKLALIDK
jgi:hypothetical protein